MDVTILAAIIQGEGGVLGPVGMYAVASVLATQLDAGWLPFEIDAAWYGREEPESYACYLAEAIDAGRIPADRYLHCYSKQDVKEQGFKRPGDLVVSRPGSPYQLHLYEEFPG